MNDEKDAHFLAFQQEYTRLKSELNKNHLVYLNSFQNQISILNKIELLMLSQINEAKSIKAQAEFIRQTYKKQQTNSRAELFVGQIWASERWPRFGRQITNIFYNSAENSARLYIEYRDFNTTTKEISQGRYTIIETSFRAWIHKHSCYKFEGNGEKISAPSET